MWGLPWRRDSDGFQPYCKKLRRGPTLEPSLLQASRTTNLLCIDIYTYLNTEKYLSKRTMGAIYGLFHVKCFLCRLVIHSNLIKWYYYIVFEFCLVLAPRKIPCRYGRLVERSLLKVLAKQSLVLQISAFFLFSNIRKGRLLYIRPVGRRHH